MDPALIAEIKRLTDVILETSSEDQTSSMKAINFAAGHIKRLLEDTKEIDPVPSAVDTEPQASAEDEVQEKRRKRNEQDLAQKTRRSRTKSQGWRVCPHIWGTQKQATQAGPHGLHEMDAWHQATRKRVYHTPSRQDKLDQVNPDGGYHERSDVHAMEMLGLWRRGYAFQKRKALCLLLALSSVIKPKKGALFKRGQIQMQVDE